VTPQTIIAAGVREFLAKPLSKQELAEAVTRTLDGKAVTPNT